MSKSQDLRRAENTSPGKTIEIHSWETYIDDGEDPVDYGDIERDYLPGDYDEETPLQEDVTWTADVPSGIHIFSVKYIGTFEGIENVTLAEASFSLAVE